MDPTVVLSGESVSFQTENAVWNPAGEAWKHLSVNGVSFQPDSFSSAGNHFFSLLAIRIIDYESEFP